MALLESVAPCSSFTRQFTLQFGKCGFNDDGAEALFESPHLQNLVELRLESNGIRTGADALLDPGLMPQLGVCWLTGNKILKESAERIKQVRPHVNV